MKRRTLRKFKVRAGQVADLRRGFAELRRRSEEVLQALNSEYCTRHAMYLIEDNTQFYLIVERIDKVGLPQPTLAKRWEASGNPIYLLLDTMVMRCLDLDSLENLPQDLVISAVPETLFVT